MSFTHDGQESSRIFSSTARTGPYGMVSLKTPGRPASGRSRRFLMNHHSQDLHVRSRAAGWGFLVSPQVRVLLVLPPVVGRVAPAM